MTDQQREDAASVVAIAAVEFISTHVRGYKGIDHVGTAELELAIYDWLMVHAVFKGEQDERRTSPRQ